jgi:hypothetical protein
MTQANPTNGYTISFMDSTDVYNYMKRMARKTSNSNIDCTAEALISVYGDDTAIDTVELKQILINPGRMTEADYREMQCHVTTSMRTVSLSEAHVD